MPQAQTGKTKSTPKVVRVNADDGNAVLYRNLGNGRRLPFIWGDSFTLASGTTEVVVSSGVSFNDHEVAGAIVTATPISTEGGALDYFISKDTVNNVVKLSVDGGAPTTDCDFDVIFILGVGYNFDNTHTNQVFWKDQSITYTGS